MKQQFLIIVSQCQKTEREDPQRFSTSILSKTSKNLNGEPFGEKNSQ